MSESEFPSEPERRSGATAALPFGLGLLGTWFGHRQIQAIVEQLDPDVSVRQEILYVGYRIAWLSTHMGFVLAMLLVVIAYVGWASWGH